MDKKKLIKYGEGPLAGFLPYDGLLKGEFFFFIHNSKPLPSSIEVSGTNEVLTFQQILLHYFNIYSDLKNEEEGKHDYSALFLGVSSLPVDYENTSEGAYEYLKLVFGRGEVLNKNMFYATFVFEKLFSYLHDSYNDELDYLSNEIIKRDILFLIEKKILALSALLQKPDNNNTRANILSEYLINDQICYEVLLSEEQMLYRFTLFLTNQINAIYLGERTIKRSIENTGKNFQQEHHLKLDQDINISKELMHKYSWMYYFRDSFKNPTDIINIMRLNKKVITWIDEDKLLKRFIKILYWHMNYLNKKPHKKKKKTIVEFSAASFRDEKGKVIYTKTTIDSFLKAVNIENSSYSLEDPLNFPLD